LKFNSDSILATRSQITIAFGQLSTLLLPSCQP